jgi:hypothetical protein
MTETEIMRSECTSNEYAYKWLTKNMRMVSRHNYQVDHKVAYPRVMIYPRFDPIPASPPESSQPERAF